MRVNRDFNLETDSKQYLLKGETGTVRDYDPSSDTWIVEMDIPDRVYDATYDTGVYFYDQ